MPLRPYIKLRLQIAGTVGILAAIIVALAYCEPRIKLQPREEIIKFEDVQ